jgi:hypothetical protein
LPRFAAASSRSRFCARFTPRPVSSSALKQFRRVLSQQPSTAAIAGSVKPPAVSNITRSRCFTVGTKAFRPRFDIGSGFANSGIFCPISGKLPRNFTPRAKNLGVAGRAGNARRARGFFATPRCRGIRLREQR